MGREVRLELTSPVIPDSTVRNFELFSPQTKKGGEAVARRSTLGLKVDII